MREGVNCFTPEGMRAGFQMSPRPIRRRPENPGGSIDAMRPEMRAVAEK